MTPDEKRILDELNRLRKVALPEEPDDITRFLQETEGFAGLVPSESIAFGLRRPFTIQEVRSFIQDTVDLAMQSPVLRSRGLFIGEAGEPHAAVSRELVVGLVGSMLLNDQFDLSPSAFADATGVNQAVMDVVLDQNERVRAFPGSATKEMQLSGVIRALEQTGFITLEMRQAILQEDGYNRSLLSEAREILAPILNNMDEFVTGAISARSTSILEGGIDPDTGQPFDLTPQDFGSSVVSYIGGLSTKDIGAGNTPIPPMLLPEVPEVTGRGELLDLVTPKTGSVPPENGIKKMVDKALIIGDKNISEVGFGTDEAGKLNYKATVRARNQLIRDATKFSADNPADYEGLVNFVVSEVGAFDSDVERAKSEIQTGKETDARAKVFSTQDKNEIAKLALQEADLSQSAVTSERFEYIARLAKDFSQEQIDAYVEINKEAFKQERVDQDREDASLIDRIERVSEGSRTLSDFDDEAKRALRIIKADRPLTKDDIDNAFSATIERKAAVEAEEAEEERVTDVEAANVAALKTSELERTLQSLGIGQLGSDDAFQQNLRQNVLPKLAVHLETIRRGLDPGEKLDTALHIGMMLGIPGFQEEPVGDVGLVEQVQKDGDQDFLPLGVSPSITTEPTGDQYLKEPFDDLEDSWSRRGVPQVTSQLEEVGGLPVTDAPQAPPPLTKQVLDDSDPGPRTLGDLFNKATEDVIKGTLQPMSGTGIMSSDVSREEFNRRFNEADTPGLPSQYREVLAELGMPQLPTLGAVGTTTQTDLLNIQKDTDLDTLRFSEEASGGDPFFQKFILEQLQTEDFETQLRKSAAEAADIKEKAAFAKYGEVWGPEGLISAAPDSRDVRQIALDAARDRVGGLLAGGWRGTPEQDVLEGKAVVARQELGKLSPKQQERLRLQAENRTPGMPRGTTAFKIASKPDPISPVGFAKTQKSRLREEFNLLPATVQRRQIEQENRLADLETEQERQKKRALSRGGRTVFQGLR